MDSRPTTRELIDLFRLGGTAGEEAATELYSRFRRIVRWFAQTQIGPLVRGAGADASDLRTKAFKRFFSWVETTPSNPIEDTRHAHNLLARIVRRLGKNVSTAKPPPTPVGDPESMAQPASLSFEELTDSLELIEKVKEQSDDRTCRIVCLFQDGYRIDEIAEREGVTRQTVHNRLQRFGNQLRKKIEKLDNS